MDADVLANERRDTERIERGKEMTQDEIIEMAMLAGFESDDAYVQRQELKAFYNIAIAKEREACAKACEDDINGFEGAWYLANKIRARGEA